MRGDKDMGDIIIHFCYADITKVPIIAGGLR